MVKVESVQRPDGMRYTTTAPRAEQWWEWCPVFHGANAGKRSITLALNDPDGLALAKRLIEGADAVIENFSTRASWRTSGSTGTPCTRAIRKS